MAQSKPFDLEDLRKRMDGTFSTFNRMVGSFENNVLVIPGNVFSSRDTHFRISYATSLANIEKGLDRMDRFVRGLKK